MLIEQHSSIRSYENHHPAGFFRFFFFLHMQFWIIISNTLVWLSGIKNSDGRYKATPTDLRDICSMITALCHLPASRPGRDCRWLEEEFWKMGLTRRCSSMSLPTQTLLHLSAARAAKTVAWCKCHKKKNPLASHRRSVLICFYNCVKGFGQYWLKCKDENLLCINIDEAILVWNMCPLQPSEMSFTPVQQV